MTRHTNHSGTAICDPPPEDLTYLPASAVRDALAQLDVVEVVRNVLLAHAAGAATLPAEAYLPWVNERGEACRSLNMPGLLSVSGRRMAGTKIMNASVGNPGRGLDRAAGLVLLFDPETARVRCVLDAATISASRTAAVSVLAAEVLAPGTNEVGCGLTVGFVGAGPLAKAHAELMTDRWSGLGEILIFDHAPGRAEALAVELNWRRGPRVRVAATAEQAVRSADIVVPVTTTTRPYIDSAWIAPGSTVLNVSLDDIEGKFFVDADLLYVDDWSLVVNDQTRLMGHLAREGILAPPPGHDAAAGFTTSGARAVTGTLGQLLAGQVPPRSAPGQRVLVNPFGMALHDVAVASAVRDVAVATGSGVVLQR